MFRVGEEVVCIDDELHKELQPTAQSGLDGLKKGQLYHIRWCGKQDDGTNHWYVRLMEIDRGQCAISVNGGDAHSFEPGFFAFRFKRPIAKKTSIEIFEKMLNPSDETKKKHSKWLKEVRELEKEDALYKR